MGAGYHGGFGNTKGSKKHILLDYKRHLIYNLIEKNS